MTFERFLIDKHADQYNGLDDEMPDDYDRWIEELDIYELVDLAEEWHKSA